LHADGGYFGTKPYAASANYINRMSDYCGACPYDPRAVVGERACPYNALYWDFIARHEARFARNPRMALPLRNWQAKPADERSAIRTRAEALRERLRAGDHL
jgi:deoxyribodipyrimidine photolyase-related protein